MDEKSLRSLSPLDGRYHEKTQVTREIFSELGLIKHRLKVEVEWLKYFLNNFEVKLRSNCGQIMILVFYG